MYTISPSILGSPRPYVYTTRHIRADYESLLMSKGTS
jgi:hypothetical protein